MRKHTSHFIQTFVSLCLMLVIGSTVDTSAQGWADNYGGVMLQGFYWDSYNDTKWTRLEKQADELAEWFDLIWVPQSGKSKYNPSMGYDDLYWYDQNSSFGTEAELRSMIAKYKALGTGIIADVVINHRETVSTWTDFPAEVNPLDGKTYQLLNTDICSDDEAAANGHAVGPNKDTGDGWSGMRDLDHKSENVQNNVIAYLRYLKDYLGYAGFRYDMVKGYSPIYTALYNSTVGVEFSVGEYWDNYSSITSWVNATKIDGVPQSAAFDFALKYDLNTCCNSGANWNRLLATHMQNTEAYRRYAVTFCDNHDTRRESSAMTRNVLAANAWILATPGTPCVFLPDWKLYKHELASMIQARRIAGVTNTSSIISHRNTAAATAAIVVGSKGRLLVWMGNQADNASGINGFTKILEGENYSYWLENNLLSEWEARKEPTFAEDSTEKHTITIYLKEPEPKWNKVYFYAWDGNQYINDSWPGVDVTSQTTTIDGARYYYRSFTVSAEEDYTMNIIFNIGSNAGQTVDITGINSDRYYEISSTVNKYTVNDLTRALGVAQPSIDGGQWQQGNYFDLMGRPLQQPRKGLFIDAKGRKVLLLQK